jgi:DNA modification methylase
MIIDNARIENMDCLEFLKTIPDNSTNLVLFDEPYMLLKGHKIEEGYNLDIALQVRTEAMRVLKKDGWFLFFGQFPSAYDFYTKTLEAGFKPWQACNEIVWCKRAISSPFGKIGRIHENIFVFQKRQPYCL